MTLQATRYQAGRVKCEAFKPTMITTDILQDETETFIPSNCFRYKDFTQTEYHNEEKNRIHFEEVQLVVFLITYVYFYK